MGVVGVRTFYMAFSFNFIARIWSWTSPLQARRPRRHSPHLWRRRYVGTLVLLLLLIGVSSFFWYFSTDERVRLQAIKALQENTGGEVELDEASLMVLRQIRIKGLKIFLPNRPHKDENLVLAADDVILEHVPWSILTRRLQLKEVVAYGPRLQIWYDRDRKIINLQLLPLHQTGQVRGARPKIYLRNGTVEYQEFFEGKPSRKARQKLNGRIYPAAYNNDIILFEWNGETEGALRRSSLRGMYHLRTKQLRTRGDFMLELMDFTQLPGRVSQWQKLYEMSRPVGQVETFSSYDPQMGHQFRMRLENGQLNLPVPQVKVPLQQVQAEILCTNEKIIIEKLNGRYENHCSFDVRGTIAGYTEDAGFDLEIRTQDLFIPPDQWSDGNAVDETGPQTGFVSKRQALTAPMKELLTLLPEDGQNLARNLAPTGRLELYLRLQRNQSEATEEMHYRGVLTLVDAAINYEHFPYQLEHMRGEVIFEPDHLSIGPLESRQAGQVTLVEGRWERQQEQTNLVLRARVDNLPLDPKLFAALHPWQKKLWQKFEPSGTVHGTYQLKQENQQKKQERLDIDFLNVNACCADFPLPLSALSGEAHYEDGMVRFDIKQPPARSSWMALKGELENLRQGAGRIDCEIDFHNLELDEAFLSSLSGPSRKLYEKIGLRGQADGRAHIYTASSNRNERHGEEPNAISPWGDIDYQIAAQVHEGRLLYEKFPYELRDVQAQVELSREKLSIGSLQGRHGNSRIDMKGFIENKQPQEGVEDCRFELKLVSVSMDKEFQEVLPLPLRKMYDRMAWGGTIDAELMITRRPVDEEKELWNINGRSGLKDGTVSWPAPADRINGWFQGELSYDSHSKELSYAGVLQADGLRIKQRPLTHLTAQVKYDGREKALQLRQISSGFCSGQLAGEMQADFKDEPAGYEFKLRFHEVDLAQFLDAPRPAGEKRRNLKGQVEGWLNVSQPGDLAQRRGSFLFNISHAVLGELPLMARLLHVLNLSLPKEGAFNEASIKGDVAGGQVYFDPIQLRGSAVALSGAGIMKDPNNHLELFFEVESPHKLPNIPIISSFIRAVSPSLMQVQVSGNFDDPQVEPVAFPSRGKALRQSSPDPPAPLAPRKKKTSSNP